MGSPNQFSEKEAGNADESEDSQRRRESTRCSQPTLVHVEPVGLTLHQVQELGVHPLAVKVVDRVLEGVLVALLALAFVAPGPKTSPKDGDAVRRFLVTFVGPLESVGGVIVVGALVDVQHLDVHRHSHGSLELNPVPQTVPTKEGRSISDFPHWFPNTLERLLLSNAKT